MEHGYHFWSIHEQLSHLLMAKPGTAKPLKDAKCLNPVTTQGRWGTILQVRGATLVNLSLVEHNANQTLFVADSLTSQGILGMDFLESNNYILDLADGKLHVHWRKDYIPLGPLHVGMQASVQADITVQENFIVGYESEIEIMANISTFGEGTWLVDDHLHKKPEVLIARAVVSPWQGRIPLRILNLNTEPLTIYKGMKLAHAELLEKDIDTVSAVNANHNLGREHQSLVDMLMETLPRDLSSTQHE